MDYPKMASRNAYSVKVRKVLISTIQPLPSGPRLITVFARWSIGILLSLQTIARADDALPTADDIRSSWEKRCTAVRTLRFTVDEEQFLGKGALPLGQGSASSSKPSPPRDVTLPATFTIIAQSELGRFSESRSMWSEQTNEVVKQDFVSVVNGKQARTFFEKGQVAFPNGEISEGSALEYLFNYQPALPITLCYRIMSPEFTAISVRGEMQIEDVPGQSERVVMASFRRGNGVAHLWLARDRDFIPLRFFVVSATGQTLENYDITYSTHSESGWIPAHWESTHVFSSDGVSATSRKASVIEAEINQTVSAQELTLAFPAGTWVNDQVTKQSYIVRADGSKRIAGPGEGSADYDRIMGEDPSFTFFGARGIFIGFNLVAVSLLLWLWIRRRALAAEAK